MSLCSLTVAVIKALNGPQVNGDHLECTFFFREKGVKCICLHSSVSSYTLVEVKVWLLRSVRACSCQQEAQTCDLSVGSATGAHSEATFPENESKK